MYESQLDHYTHTELKFGCVLGVNYRHMWYEHTYEGVFLMYYFHSPGHTNLNAHTPVSHLSTHPPQTTALLASYISMWLIWRRSVRTTYVWVLFLLLMSRAIGLDGSDSRASPESILMMVCARKLGNISYGRTCEMARERQRWPMVYFAGNPFTQCSHVFTLFLAFPCFSLLILRVVGVVVWNFESPLFAM